MQSVNRYQVSLIACFIFIASLMASITTEASNSFTPIDCFDCSSYSSPYPSNKNEDVDSRRGQYVGSVIAAPLDDNVLINENYKHSKPYSPETSSFLSVASGYSTSSNADSPKSMDSTFKNLYNSNENQKKPNIKDRYHPTTFDGSQSLFQRPANSLAGSILGNVAGAIAGRLPGNAAFRDPGGGFGGALSGSGTFRSPGGESSGVIPGNIPFGSPGSGFGGGLPGSTAFGSPGSGLGGNVPGNIPFGTPGGGLGGGPPGGPSFGSASAGLGGSPFGSPGGVFGGGVPANGFFGRPQNGLGGGVQGNPAFGSPNAGGFPGNPNNLLGSSLFGTPGGGFPGVLQGNPGFGSSGTGLQGHSPSPEGGTHGGLGQQVIGENEQESGVGEVILPAQTELRPEVVQSTSNDASYKQPSSYGYGYPPSLYQQPLPDITEPPIAKPTAIINESPPPVILDKPTGIVAPVGPVRPPPPVPVVSPPIYGYYYIGRKAWYVPLYFCVYFIVYVGCLILKHIYRHKAHFPETLHDAVVNARARNDKLNLLTETFLIAFDKYKSLLY